MAKGTTDDTGVRANPALFSLRSGDRVVVRRGDKDQVLHRTAAVLIETFFDQSSATWYGQLDNGWAIPLRQLSPDLPAANDPEYKDGA